MSAHYDIVAPNFQLDLAYGEKGEQVIKNFLTDLSSGSLEVKTDRYRNGRMVIETHQRPKGQEWKPSGISITHAKWWVYQYHFDGAFQIVSTERIKRYLNATNHEIKHFAISSDNPSKGYLLYPEHITDMLINPKYDEQ